MSANSRKAIFWKVVLTFLSIIPIIFSRDEFNKKKIDIYFFVDKVRYPENIAYDIIGIFSIIILYHTIYKLIPERRYKRYSFAFLLVAWLGLPLYFLFYSQFISIYLIPLLLICLLCAHLKNKNEKRDYIG